jgi:hypothetical protein
MHVSSWSRGAVALGCTGAARGVAWHGRESPVAQCVLLADSRAWVCALPTDVPWRSPMAPGQLLGLGVDLREADALALPSPTRASPPRFASPRCVPRCAPCGRRDEPGPSLAREAAGRSHPRVRLAGPRHSSDPPSCHRAAPRRARPAPPLRQVQDEGFEIAQRESFKLRANRYVRRPQADARSRAMFWLRIPAGRTLGIAVPCSSYPPARGSVRDRPARMRLPGRCRIALKEGS